MANDLTLFTPVFTASDPYGSNLSGGYGYVSSAVLPTSLPITIEGRIKNSTTGLQVAFGQGGLGWVGCDAAGKLVAHYGNNTDVTITTTFSVTDGVERPAALVITASGGRLYIDGNLVGSSATVGDFNPTASPSFGVRALGQVTHNTIYDWKGTVDEVAIWSDAHYSANYTPAPVSNTAGNLSAIWHLNGDGINSKGIVAATAVVFTGPSAGSVGIASSAFSFTLNGSYTGTVTVTPSDGGAGGSWSPSTVAVVAGTASTATYTAASAGAKTLSETNNAGLTDGAPITYTASAANVPVFDPAKIQFSPGNWNIQAGFARTICSGAYFNALIGGTTCTLNFDMTGLATPYPKLAYRFDRHGPVNYVTLAATITLSIPTDVPGYAAHYLEVIVDATSEAVDNWSGGCMVAFTGFTLDSGKTISLPVAKTGGNILAIGDSITRGINTLNGSGDATVRSSALQSWALIAAERLGCEIGIVGFGGQGLTVGGAGNVPVVNSTYGFLYAGVARSYVGIDLVMVNQGTNDGSTNITSAATTFLNGLIAAIPSTTKVLVLRPFNGAHGSEWQAAIAACSAPSRITYQDTTGWFTTANAVDGLHPYGFEDIFHIAPLADAALRAVLGAGGALIPNSVSLVLGRLKRSANGAAIPSGKRLRVS